MNKVDELNHIRPVRVWITLLRKLAENEGINQFIDKFMYIVHIFFMEITLLELFQNARSYCN